jgi:CSLREA domain-containing protein
MYKFARIFLGFLFVFLVTPTVFSATFTVTKTADTNDGTCDADCSLREAVAAANAAAGEDIVNFDATVFGTPQTIVLSLGEIVITGIDSLTLNGTGADMLTINGNMSSRILSINLGIAFINDMTFTGGNGAGTLNTGRAGAIYNAGSTTVINNCVITGNTASNGGGLNNSATGTPSVPGDLTINNSIVSNNSATGSGGGMQNFSTSTVRINNSTFMGNTSNGTTGGGGGAFNGRAEITNSTFANNSAPTGSGGGIQSNGSLGTLLTNVTVSGNSSLNNGGGVHRGTTNINIFIRNSIIAGNNGSAASPDVTHSANGSISSQGNNIIGNVGTSTGWVASDLLNTNPMLGPLADNGGFGMTFLPQAGSPAIDAGDNCVLDLSCPANNPPVAVTTDQRGVPRPQGPTVDIGSVEVASAAASATVRGRVFSPGGIAVSQAMVTISDTNGVIQTAITNNFGYFTFTEIPTGQMYTLNVLSKQYNFAPQDVTVNSDVTGITITAGSENLKKFGSKIFK